MSDKILFHSIKFSSALLKSKSEAKFVTCSEYRTRLNAILDELKCKIRAFFKTEPDFFTFLINIFKLN